MIYVFIDCKLEHTWTHGEQNPYIIYSNLNETNWEKLVSANNVLVRADKIDLQLIRQNFIDLPYHANRLGYCEWAGDMAKFIALNFDF